MCKPDAGRFILHEIGTDSGWELFQHGLCAIAATAGCRAGHPLQQTASLLRQRAVQRAAQVHQLRSARRHLSAAACLLLNMIRQSPRMPCVDKFLLACHENSTCKRMLLVAPQHRLGRLYNSTGSVQTSDRSEGLLDIELKLRDDRLKFERRDLSTAILTIRIASTPTPSTRNGVQFSESHRLSTIA